MEKTNKVQPLYGLVLVGGRSTRMKQDKAALDFHGTKQSAYGYHLLKPFCEQVFLSAREEQVREEWIAPFPQIHDIDPFVNIGPLGGILSAMTQYPHVGWLVLACDLPFVTEKTIQHLISHRRTEKWVTAFLSSSDKLPEPLCTIYEPIVLDFLLDYRKEGKTCPRKFLITHEENIQTVRLPVKMALDNINDLDEYRKAKSYLGSRR